MPMNEEKFREVIVKIMKEMSESLKEMNKNLEYIGSRLDEIRMEIIPPSHGEE